MPIASKALILKLGVSLQTSNVQTSQGEFTAVYDATNQIVSDLVVLTGSPVTMPLAFASDVVVLRTKQPVTVVLTPRPTDAVPVPQPVSYAVTSMLMVEGDYSQLQITNSSLTDPAEVRVYVA